MTRRRRTKQGNRRKQQELPAKLIGAGLFLAVMPLVLGKSAVGAALSPLVPVGFVILAIGCVLLWLKVRDAAENSAVAPMSAGSPSPTPFRAPEISPAPVNRTPTGVNRLISAEPLRPLQPDRLHPASWGPQVFEVIEWRRFEALVEALFAQSGLETRTQSHGADEGIDIWLFSRSTPGAPVSIVQCKHWSGKQVGVDKVRELRGVMASKNITRGQFATTSTFTPEAMAFARDNGINLLDASGLLSLIGTRTAEQQQALLEVALEGEYWRPTCVNCGIKMVDRIPKKGGNAFWGCSHFPQCKTTMPMRTSAIGARAAS